MGTPPAPAVIAILSTLVEERTGLHHGVADHASFVDKVAERARTAGYDSLLDYYYFLRYDPDAETELRHLVDALVVNETYFFREPAPLAFVVDRLVERVAAGHRPRVWSAACATGEEPLTLAMMLYARGVLGRVELIASDISYRALARARTGVYPRRSLRGPLPPAGQPWLRVEGDSVQVAPGLLAAVHWRRLNLLDDDAVTAIGPCDVILCRNVLIYFSDETVTRVVGRLVDRLIPGGTLLVGVSESLLRFTSSLSCEETAGIFHYRKPS
jgi:chemotaxis protein methyltransferase CheR